MAATFARIPHTPDTRAAVEKIHERHGCLREEDVVRESKKQSSALHPYFLWDDDSAAAHLARLEIARTFIRTVTIIREEFEERRINASVVTGPVRKYHGTGNGQYLDLKKILEDPESRENLLKRALGDIKAFRRRYEQFDAIIGQDLRPIYRAADRVEKHVESLFGTESLSAAKVPATTAARN